MLTVAAPLGLLALAGIPLVVALHLFRRSYRPRPVTALFLWGADARAGGGGRMRQPLRNRLSLWCEILACLALAWLLADVRLVRSEAGRHLVLVADSRWSMQARSGGSSAWERVRTEGLHQLAGLDPSDRASLVASGRVPRLLAGPAVPAQEAADALASLQPDQADHDLGPALALAAQLGGPGAELLLLSDRPPERPPRGLGWAVRGLALPTSALADAGWRDEHGRGRVLARMVAGVAEQTRGWQLLDGTRVLAQGTAQAAPGRPALISIPVPTAVGDRLELRLLGDDPIACDDACHLRRPAPRRLAARVMLPEGGLARRAVVDALSAVGGVALAETGPVQLEVGAGAGRPGTGTWRLSLMGGDGPVQLGPFLGRAGHPLLDGLDGAGLLWAGSATAASPGEEVLLSAAGRVLVGELRQGPWRELRLHLDWSRGQLHRHPAWPGLVANWCALRRSWLPGPERSTLRLGEPCAVQLPPGIEACELVAPDGIAVRVGADLDGRIVLPGLERPGTWQLRFPGGEWALEAVALDARLADLSAAASGDQAPAPAGVATARRDSPPLARLLPLLLAAGALALSWVAHRRESGAA